MRDRPPKSGTYFPLSGIKQNNPLTSAPPISQYVADATSNPCQSCAGNASRDLATCASLHPLLNVMRDSHSVLDWLRWFVARPVLRRGSETELRYTVTSLRGGGSEKCEALLCSQKLHFDQQGIYIYRRGEKRARCAGNSRILVVPIVAARNCGNDLTGSLHFDLHFRSNLNYHFTVAFCRFVRECLRCFDFVYFSLSGLWYRVHSVLL